MPQSSASPYSLHYSPLAASQHGAVSNDAMHPQSPFESGRADVVKCAPLARTRSDHAIRCSVPCKRNTGYNAAPIFVLLQPERASKETSNEGVDDRSGADAQGARH